MSGVSNPGLSVTSLFAERDARRRRDEEAAEQLQRRKEEELAAFRQRLDNFRLDRRDHPDRASTGSSVRSSVARPS